MKRGAESAKVFSRDMNKLGAQATQLGSALTKTLTLPILGLGATSVKAAMDFESSFAGIRKTVQATEQQFAGLSRELRELSKTIPVNVNELNKIGEAAGQLGIKTESILGFTEVMAKLGVTTNLTSDQAATALARMANITQMPQDSFDRLGATVVQLGNEFASTEAEIVEFGLRIAGAGAQAGMSEANILAIGTALSSVGVEAEAGGTAVQKVILDMIKAIQTGNKDLAVFAQTAGMTADQFKTAFAKDAGEAFTRFVEGLGRQGNAAINTLAELGLEDQRLLRSFLALSGAGDLLRRSIESSNTAWQQNTALTREAAERFKTTESQLTLLWNRIKDVGITLGNALLPLITSTVGMLDKLIPLVDMLAKSFAALPVPVQAKVVGTLALVAAAGPALLIFGQLAFAVGALARVFTTGGLLSSLGLATVATRGLTVALTGLRTVLAPLMALWAGWEIGKVAREFDVFGLKLKSWVPVLWNWKLGLAGISLENLMLAETSKEALAAYQQLQQLKRDSGISGQRTGDITLTPAGPVIAPSQMSPATEAAKKYAEAIQELVHRLGGAEAIAAAKLWMDALPKIGGLTKLATDDQVELNRILNDAIDAYRRLGKEAPLALRALALETSALVAQNRALTSGMGVGPASLPSKTFDDFVLPSRVIGTGMGTGPVKLPPAREIGQSLAQQLFGGFMGDLNSIFQSAFEGGGGAIGAIKSFATKAVAVLANMIPGVGPIISKFAGAIVAGFSKLFGKLFGRTEESTKVSPLRDEFFKLHGGLEKLNPQVLALTGNLKLVEAVFKAKTVEEYTAAIKALEDVLHGATQAVMEAREALVSVQDKLASVTTLTPELQAALDAAFNASTPQEYLKALEDINRVIDEQAAKQQKILSTLEKYGLEWTEAGKAVKQAKLNEIAQGLITDFDILVEAGVDINHQMKAMGPSIRDFIKDAQKAGVEVPESMRRIIQTAIDAGEVFDENGNKVTDITQLGLKFGVTMETAMTSVGKAVDRLTLVLEALARFLGIELPKAAEKAADGINDALDDIEDPEINVRVNVPKIPSPDFPTDWDFEPESFGVGSGGIRDFGSGTPAILHGREGVYTEQQMAMMQRSSGPVTIENHFHGPVLAEDAYVEQHFGRPILQSFVRYHQEEFRRAVELVKP